MVQRLEFPTGVGMNLITDFESNFLIRVPHRRGDEPIRELLIIHRWKSSPQAWG